jgi:protocatechuate 3,4-dioxygenase beta subunit
MQRTTWIGLAFVVVAVVLATWKLSQPSTGASETDERSAADENQPRARSKWFWEGDDEPNVAARPPAPPRARTLRVSNEQGDPLGGVKVSLLQSATLERFTEHPPENCDDFEHLTKTAEDLRRDGAALSVVAEAVTDHEGNATFPERFWPRSLVVQVERPGLPPFAARDFLGDEVLVSTREPATMQFTVFTSNGDPLPGARVTIVDLSGGRVFEVRTDASGVASARGGFSGFVIVEAEGRFPAVSSVSLDGDPDQRFVLYRPGVIEIASDPKVGRFEVALAAQHERRTQVTDGTGRFERVRPGFHRITVSTPGLLGEAEGSLEEDPGHVLINLPIKRSARLLVTVVDAQGMPVPDVSAALTSPSASVEASAQEEGERLVLGPVGEGPAVLRVTAPAFRARSQSIELKAGDTDLEVVMAKAPALRGRVVDQSGLPVPEVAVRVRDTDTNQPGGATTGPDGTFEIHVDEEGSWPIEAFGEQGVGRAVAVVPGADVTIRLEGLGSATLTVLEESGKPAVGSRVMIASTESPEPDMGEVNEEGVLEFSELVPGSYRYEVDDQTGGERFLTQKGEFVVRSNETSVLTVKVRAGLTVTGVLVDAKGKPVPYATLSASGVRPAAFETGEDGEFLLSGLEPGVEVELSIQHPDYSALSPSKIRTNAGRVKLQALEGARVHGRVVDGQGAPITEFTVDAVDILSDTGEFSVAVGTSGTVTVATFDGAETVVEVKGRTELGDIVVKLGPEVHGRIVDDQRRPVPMVTIGSTDFAEGQATTDAQGRFQARLIRPVSTIQVEVQLGELGLNEAVPVGEGSIELVLRPPTRVEGLVRGPGGRPVVTTVRVTSASGETIEVDSDPNGAFTVSLKAGRWVFGTRAFRTSQLVVVSGDSQRVELGAASEGCEVRVVSAPLPTGVLLFPPGVPVTAKANAYSDLWMEPPLGAITLGSDGAAFVGRGVPCGAVTVQAIFGGLEVTTATATLGSGPNVITVTAPSLWGSSETIGMRFHPAPHNLEGDEMNSLISEAMKNAKLAQPRSEPAVEPY